MKRANKERFRQRRGWNKEKEVRETETYNWKQTSGPWRRRLQCEEWNVCGQVDFSIPRPCRPDGSRMVGTVLVSPHSYCSECRQNERKELNMSYFGSHFWEHKIRTGTARCVCDVLVRSLIFNLDKHKSAPSTKAQFMLRRVDKRNPLSSTLGNWNSWECPEYWRLSQQSFKSKGDPRQ